MATLARPPLLLLFVPAVVVVRGAVDGVFAGDLRELTAARPPPATVGSGPHIYMPGGYLDPNEVPNPDDRD